MICSLKILSYEALIKSVKVINDGAIFLKAHFWYLKAHFWRFYFWGLSVLPLTMTVSYLTARGHRC